MPGEKKLERRVEKQSGRVTPLPDRQCRVSQELRLARLKTELSGFRDFGTPTRIERLAGSTGSIPVFSNEFWTSKQRAASSLHEIPYRACFKPQLPRFLISRLSEQGDTIYDPFMGRGTTLLEASFLGRKPLGGDANPLSRYLLQPRLNPPDENQIACRLENLTYKGYEEKCPDDLLAFYHPKTLRELCALRSYLLAREASGQNDFVDDWIRMVATSRLSGHSSGFFSVYTLPPNQAVTVKEQRKINQRRNQEPPHRRIKDLILRKSHALLSRVSEEERHQLATSGRHANLFTSSADETPDICSDSVSLIVTSPPFLDLVDYRKDNWLRNWFNGIEPSSLPVWQFRSEREWSVAMTSVFQELRRILVPGGFIGFEVGDLKSGALLMEDLVIPAAQNAGLSPRLVMINEQDFTKTSHCWGVSNSRKGTKTNRIVLLQKSD